MAAIAAAQDSTVHTVPFVPAASDAARQGLVRIINKSAEAGTVRISAFDDTGRRIDGISISIDGNATAHCDSQDLEYGNPDIGLTGSTGAGEGAWRLELSSDLDIEPRGYAIKDGFLNALHDTAPRHGDGYRVATFNPGSNSDQQSLLRLVNPGAETTSVTILGTDDEGTSPGDGVTVDIPAGEARTFAAKELESGDATGLTGSLGDGVGKWRLNVQSARPILVMSLLSTPTGHLTNLSPVPSHEADGVHRVPLFPPASDPFGRQGFVRVVNLGDEAGVVSIEAFDDTEWAYEPLSLSLDGGEAAHFNSDDLELGNAAKGLTGSTGSGSGYWRLELTSTPDIDVLTYVRTNSGYVTAMHGTASRQVEGEIKYQVPIFYPKQSESHDGWLHLVNHGTAVATVAISGIDDLGRAAPGGEVGLQLGANEARTLTAAGLTDGEEGVTGRFGIGTGRWRLTVSVDRPLLVMSLGHSGAGFLANLSRGRPPADDPQPDLVVESVAPGNGTPSQGEPLNLLASVRNVGGGTAAETKMRFYRSVDSAVSTGDIQIGSVGVPALGPNVGNNQSFVTTAVAGAYHYGACVDRVPDESDTLNNCSASVRVDVPEPPPPPPPRPPPPPTPPPPRPDLAVSFSVSDREVDQGQELMLSASVTNRGDAAAAATTLRYYRSADAIISASDTSVGTEGVQALPVSGSAQGSLTTNAPTVLGTYYYGACVDSVAGETRLANNCSSGVSVEVTGPAPDLVVDNVSVNPSTVDGLDRFVLRARVRNAGDAGAAGTTLRYFLSADANVSTTDTEVGNNAVAALGALESARESAVFSAPRDVGTYYYGACADAVAGESDTTNNCSDGVALHVRIPAPPPAPDLVISTFQLSRTTLDPDEVFIGTVHVHNQGDAEARVTKFRYYISTDSTLSDDDSEVLVLHVVALGPGSTYGAGTYLDAPSQSGTYYYAACVDSVAGESDTTNNCTTTVQATVR